MIGRHLVLIIAVLITQANSASYSSRSSNTYTNDDGGTNYAGIIVILVIAAVQLILCFICYKNTERLRREAQALRAEIGLEYDAIKNAQFANMNQMAQFNYFLVYPNDVRFQATYNNQGHL